MRTMTKLGFSAALAGLLAAPSAFAQGGDAPRNDPAQMMQDQGMMSDGGMSGTGNMQGMMGMMQMMQQMRPMMEACAEMMQAMAPQSAPPAPAPQGG